MKKILAMIATLMLCSATLTVAADAPAAAKKAPATKMDNLMPSPTDTPMAMGACPKMNMGGGGMGMMSAPPSPDLMKKMQEQMEKIRQTTDPAERQKLLQEHFQSMQEAMQAMRGKMGMAGGMGGCMHRHNCCCQQSCAKTKSGKNGMKGENCARGKGMGAMSRGPDSMQGGMPPGAGMMEQRMDMMQMMMENMLEHQRQMQPNK